MAKPAFSSGRLIRGERMSSDQNRPAGHGMDGGAGTANHCRQAANMAIRAFVSLLVEAQTDGQIPLASVARIAEIMMAENGPMADFYRRAEAAIRAAGAEAANELKRTDHLNRLIAQPFAFLLDQPDSGIVRRHLPPLFAAIRTLLGEDSYLDMHAATIALTERHRGGDGLIDWPAFHADPVATALLEDVLVALARAFHHFDSRWDWLVSMMAAPGPDGNAPPPVTDRGLAALLLALFADMAAERFDGDRTRAFVARRGVGPEKIFGALFVALTRKLES
jgi:hypothetical protein